MRAQFRDFRTSPVKGGLFCGVCCWTGATMRPMAGRPIEHDNRELKTTLGLDHFEGRAFTGFYTAMSPP